MSKMLQAAKSSTRIIPSTCYMHPMLSHAGNSFLAKFKLAIRRNDNSIKFFNEHSYEHHHHNNNNKYEECILCSKQRSLTFSFMPKRWNLLQDRFFYKTDEGCTIKTVQAKYFGIFTDFFLLIILCHIRGVLCL